MVNWPPFFPPKPKPEPEPVPLPKPSPNDPSALLWLKIGMILRKIPVQPALAGLITVPLLVFFAVSGMLAWLVLAIKFIVGIYNAF
jgi:hypothetical protein